jgi:uncharacterized protein YggE
MIKINRSKNISFFYSLTSILLNPIFVFLFLCFFYSNFCFAEIENHNLEKTVSAEAIGEVSIDVKKVLVNLSVITKGLKAAEAMNENSTIAKKIYDALKNSDKVSEIKTSNLQLYQTQKYDQIKNESVPDGYSAQNQVSFVVDINSAGIIIDDLIGLGANNLSSITPYLDPTELSNAELKAIELATKQAKIVAEKALTSLNLTPKEVSSIEVLSTSRGNPIEILNSMEIASTRAMKAAPPIEGGESKIKARVQVKISY